ncbi:hypothetical protein Vafri_2018 [Volvox africanus]|nr:hypothetical protein Vafri_2018 [Volvox africanus]
MRTSLPGNRRPYCATRNSMGLKGLCCPFSCCPTLHSGLQYVKINLLGPIVKLTDYGVSPHTVQAERTTSPWLQAASKWFRLSSMEYGLTGKPEELDADEATLLREAYISDPSWAGKGEVSTSKPAPVRAGRIVAELFDKEVRPAILHHRPAAPKFASLLLPLFP